MYTRQKKEAPEHIVQSGKAAFGFFDSIPQKMDIKGMRAPYAGIPLPSFLTNLRIKSHLIYNFSFGHFIGIIEFFDLKIFGISEVTFWNTENGKKLVYHSLMAPRRRFVPINTVKAACANYSKSRKMKVSWRGTHKIFKAEFDVKGDEVRPSAKGFIQSIPNEKIKSGLLFVSPAPTSSRCMATWICPMQIKGNIVTYTKKTQSEKKTENGFASMVLNRSYFKFHTMQEEVNGMGIVSGKEIVFRIDTSSLDAADSDTYNSNVLFCDGEETLLPPVVITHPFGIEKKWIIQDTESMIDLTFTPISLSRRTLNIIIMRADYARIYGTFDGVFLTKNGEKIVLKDFPGLVFKNKIRT